MILIQRISDLRVQAVQTSNISLLLSFQPQQAHQLTIIVRMDTDTTVEGRGKKRSARKRSGDERVAGKTRLR